MNTFKRLGQVSEHLGRALRIIQGRNSLIHKTTKSLFSNNKLSFYVNRNESYENSITPKLLYNLVIYYPFRYILEMLSIEVR